MWKSPPRSLLGEGEKRAEEGGNEESVRERGGEERREQGWREHGGGREEGMEGWRGHGGGSRG